MGLSFSIIIPCYNEELGIENTIIELRSAIPEDPSYQIVIVNDGSMDGTAEKLKTVEEKYKNIKVVHHARNRGYGAALKTGIRNTDSNLIAIIDADGTYPAERMAELVQACRSNDMVVGARTGDNVTYSKLRAFPKFFLRRWMSWIAGRDIPDINSGMRVFKKDVAERFFNILPDGFSFTVTITLAMLTNYRPTLFIPIEYKERLGKSKIKPVKDTLRFIMLILRTGTYFAPIRMFFPIISVLAVFTAISLIYDIFIIGNLGDKSVLMLLFTMNTGMFALLADMIDKRSGSS